MMVKAWSGGRIGEVKRGKGTYVILTIDLFKKEIKSICILPQI